MIHTENVKKTISDWKIMQAMRYFKDVKKLPTIRSFENYER